MPGRLFAAFIVKSGLVFNSTRNSYTSHGISHDKQTFRYPDLSRCRGRYRCRRGIGRSHQATGRQNHESRKSEENTSELQSLMRNSYAVFFLKKKNTNTPTTSTSA